MPLSSAESRPGRDNHEQQKRQSEEHTLQSRPKSSLDVETQSPHRKPSQSDATRASSSYLHPALSSTSTSTTPTSSYHTEIHRLSGTFNSPTPTEIARSKKTRRSRDSMKGLDRYGKLGAARMEVRHFGGAARRFFSI
ncbi:hypothetical protein K458DRAFT_401997 [Lentithecium fluviatile CBS 122367]|uniref:Uncharacterized protein n=1 Tax=Lentithecium fluviatile CBS 122367 TaxID=1168545 RepID=A0A6G1JBH9_9PLEO|nr:hypothetical protein K458DRAFT_401997 [Lentithecium fluviatile CBS 122367]